MEKGQEEEEVAVSPWCHWAGGRIELFVIHISDLHCDKNKNEAGECLSLMLVFL